MDCDSLLTTKVVNRLVASGLCKLVIHWLASSCFNKLKQIYANVFATNLILTGVLQLDEIYKLAASCNKLITLTSCDESVTFFWLCRCFRRSTSKRKNSPGFFAVHRKARNLIHPYNINEKNMFFNKYEILPY